MFWLFFICDGNHIKYSCHGIDRFPSMYLLKNNIVLSLLLANPFYSLEIARPRLVIYLLHVIGALEKKCIWKVHNSINAMTYVRNPCLVYILVFILHCYCNHPLLLLPLEQTIAESVADWFFDRQAVKLIDCPYPCNPTCHNLDFTRV